MSQKSKEPKQPTPWHKLFAISLETILKPVGITVLSEVPVMTNAPQADILLLRNRHESWTPEQRARLCDGIRDSNARYILIEFKYTESLSERVMQKAMGYDIFYKYSKGLRDNELQTFVVSAQTPNNPDFQESGYQPESKPGIWKSGHMCLRKAPIILLNELENTDHNIAFKLFAKRRKEMELALDRFRHNKPSWVDNKIFSMAGALYDSYFKRGGKIMSQQVTPDSFEKERRKWLDGYLSFMTPREVMSRYSKKDRLEGISTSERLEGIPASERLEGIPASERLDGLTKQERDELFSILRAEKDD